MFLFRALVVLLVLAPSLARADAIGIPDCPPGGEGAPNPHHGTGWCQAAPCTSDADCPTRPGFFGGTSGPRVCRRLGVCVWGDRHDAIASCDVEGAACTAPGYPAEGAVCSVSRYCVEASRAPVPPPTVAPPPPTTTATPTPSSGMCSLSHARATCGAWILLLAAILLRRAR